MGAVGPEEGFSQLRAEDGDEAELYHSSQDEDGMSCVTATHFARGAMSGVLARLAAALGASIVPQDGGRTAVIFRRTSRGRQLSWPPRRTPSGRHSTRSERRACLSRP
jgi:hypothetical protein